MAQKDLEYRGGHRDISDPARTQAHSSRGVHAIKAKCPFCRHHKALVNKAPGSRRCAKCKRAF